MYLIELEELIGTAFEDMVSAGQSVRELAIANNSYHGGGDDRVCDVAVKCL